MKTAAYLTTIAKAIAGGIYGGIVYLIASIPPDIPLNELVGSLSAAQWGNLVIATLAGAGFVWAVPNAPKGAHEIGH